MAWPGLVSATDMHMEHLGNMWASSAVQSSTSALTDAWGLQEESREGGGEEEEGIEEKGREEEKEEKGMNHEKMTENTDAPVCTDEMT